ncbi:regulatory helix-turn-helix LysR family protein [Paraburkholderia tropica]|uniref:Regulatory helix-turn-helix LysR family protein n=1 Tax=Paraburkholderia tropica TaxID=92647 RepID=A0ABX5MR26_9BURK|nr:regulatory helix-turn-helix LysR family protein [Paraburkholderia tropica]PZW83753.1 regulatory helix-turn-helix LysR family protein [Paraburkholderia tropica]
MAKLPDFEGLAMFAKVAEEGSFAAAARAMGVSVATVSRGGRVWRTGWARGSLTARRASWR